MAINKTGARRICVDGIAYLWKIRRQPTYAQEEGGTPLTIAVQSADREGCVLVIRLPEKHPGSWMSATPFAVRPSLVARSIREATTTGWQPRVPGAPFILTGAKPEGA
jgi:hypothetical protein